MSNQEILFNMTQELVMLERLSQQTMDALRFANAHKTSRASREAIEGMLLELSNMVAQLNVQLGFHGVSHGTTTGMGELC